jgi:predicted phage terminase large subunit-like protein
LDDNPYLDRAESIKALANLDPITKSQLLRGDWDVRQAGAKFHREWFEIVDVAPQDCEKVRYWDMAATEVKAGSDPDWTVGLLLGRSKASNMLYVLDVKRMRGTDLAVENLIKQTAALDGRAVRIRMEQEPGSSGVRVVKDYGRRILMGYQFKGIPSTGDKVLRAGPVASQAEAGNVKLVAGPWITAFLDELDLFPLGGHDDQVDTLSGALTELAIPNALDAWSDAARRIKQEREIEQARLEGRPVEAEHNG